MLDRCEFEKLKRNMKVKFMLTTSMICFFLQSRIYAQAINIHYHFGHDCSKQIEEKEIKGGCTTDERMKYVLKGNGKYFKSTKLKTEKYVRQYFNGKWNKNLAEDSLTIFKLNKKIKFKDFKKIINYLELVDKLVEENSTENKIITNWNKNTFELNRTNIQKLKKTAQKGKSGLTTDSLVQIITTYIKEKNKGFPISSTAEFLDISFQHKEANYSLSQNGVGGVNVLWNVTINDKRVSIISPELNKMIAPVLAKKMSAKKRISQFMTIKELEKTLKKE